MGEKRKYKYLDKASVKAMLLLLPYNKKKMFSFLFYLLFLLTEDYAVVQSTEVEQDSSPPLEPATCNRLQQGKEKEVSRAPVTHHRQVSTRTDQSPRSDLTTIACVAGNCM